MSRDDEPLDELGLAVAGVEVTRPRLALGRLLLWGIAACAIYWVIREASAVDDLAATVAAADWRWAVLAGLASFLTYVAATMTAVGSVPCRVAWIPTALSQVGGSFLNGVTPVRIGSMALTARVMTRLGVSGPVAVTGTGVAAVAVGFAHVVLLAGFVIVAGRALKHESWLPSVRLLLSLTLIAAAVGAVALLVPGVRKAATTHVLPALRQARSGLSEVVLHRGKLALLLTGSFLMTLMYAVCLWLSLEAFGSSLALTPVAVVFLTLGSVAQLSPTPGALGAMEAALIAGLTAMGCPAEIALPGVFLFRIVTFWLPIPLGGLAFLWLRRTDLV